MGLPQPTLPIYELTIPSTGEPIRVRPFLVKEEKLLLMALQSNDDNDVIQTTKDVIRACILDDDINIDKLPFYDVDYLFVALRAKSVGNAIDIKFTCKNVDDTGNVCGATFPAKIDAANVKVKKPDVSDTISLGNNITIKMKVPSYVAMRKILDSDGDLDKQVHLVAACIDYIQEKDKIHTRKDVTQEELIVFVENLTQGQYEKLSVFVENFPSFVVTAEAKCGKCGFDHKLEYTDFQSFFV